jgi:hypothetical protein
MAAVIWSAVASVCAKTGIDDSVSKAAMHKLFIWFSPSVERAVTVAPGRFVKPERPGRKNPYAAKQVQALCRTGMDGPLHAKARTSANRPSGACTDCKRRTGCPAEQAA